MRSATRACITATVLAALNSLAAAAEIASPVTPAPADENGSAQAQVWFERALSLDIGDEGAPHAVQAFAAMRRAAELGHTQAEFNVAAMLDSGRGAPRGVAQASICLRGRQLAATAGPPSTSGSSMKVVKACPPMWICLAPGSPPPICQRPVNA